MSQQFDQKLEQLKVDSQVLGVNAEYDSNMIEKSPQYLLQRLRQKNQLNIISPNDLSSVIFFLTENGVKCEQIDKIFSHQNYHLTKNKERQIREMPNQYSIADQKNIQKEYLDKFNAYLNDQNQFQIFFHKKNQFDVIFNQSIVTFDEQQKEEIKRSFNDSFSFVKQKNQLADLMGDSYGYQTKSDVNQMDTKKRNFYVPIEEYLQNQKISDYSDKFEGIHNLILQFESITSHVEMKRIWKILLNQFSGLEEQINDSNLENLVKQIMDNQMLANLDDNHLNYIENKMTTMKSQIIHQTILILQEEFYEKEMQGGRPQILNLRSFDCRNQDFEQKLYPIMVYIENHYFSQDLQFDQKIYKDDHGTPIWAIIYVLFRAGHYSEINNILNSYQFQDITKEFQFHFQNYIKSQESKQSLSNQEKMFIKNMIANLDTDLFQFTLYVLMINCEDVVCEHLVAKLSDWLWFNLKLCEFNLEQNNNFSQYSLEDVQDAILQQGSDHFNQKSPLNYLKTLFLIQSYQEGLNYLKNHRIFHEEFVHIYIVLKESQLLINPLMQNELWVQNFTEIIYEYIRTFAKSNPIEALNYLNFLPIEPRIQCASSIIQDYDLLNQFFDDTFEANQKLQQLQQILEDKNFQIMIQDVIENQQSIDKELSLKILYKIKAHEKLLDTLVSLFGSIVFDMQNDDYEPPKKQNILSQIVSVFGQKTSSNLIDSKQSLNIAVREYIKKFKSNYDINEHFPNQIQMLRFLEFLDENQNQIKNKKYLSAFENIDRSPEFSIFVTRDNLANQVKISFQKLFHTIICYNYIIYYTCFKDNRFLQIFKVGFFMKSQKFKIGKNYLQYLIMLFEIMNHLTNKQIKKTYRQTLYNFYQNNIKKIANKDEYISLLNKLENLSSLIYKDMI